MVLVCGKEKNMKNQNTMTYSHLCKKEADTWDRSIVYTQQSCFMHHPLRVV